ncbi:hypothetical protein B2G71_19035 [Novosphingobium sp. PC22D]|uniref:SDR family NAD(P)-dependent oxidoreductase n=1 Tax=Novosphingobium sp. PC22D TaxID=1962403 RepID=UPI000BEFF00D|nr:SDR family oxidoreductase [Novosphingobium sp. PC22D]PEQ11134.1 hypothetical protein B2G71_19035 [Novosphingobium sp. PC22D]
MNEWVRAEGVAIVTGAAGGMGCECARLLAEDGWSELVLCDLDEARLESVAAPLREQGAHVEILAGDITEAAFWDRLVALIGQRGVGAAVHTAGVSPGMAPAGRMLEINLDATVRLVETLRALMNARGAVVLFASLASHLPFPEEAVAPFEGELPEVPSQALAAYAPTPESAYPLSKRAVRAIARREAKNFGERGARIVSISPGFIDTAMMAGEMSPMVTQMLEGAALPRLGKPAELAAVATFLCSARAGFITGVDIKVEGGALAAMGIA